MNSYFSRFACLISAACLAAFALPASAQLTVFYTEGDTNSSAYSTTAPNDPLTLSLDFGTATQSGVISGTGAVTSNGQGTLVLCGDNTFTGSLTLTAGTVRATSQASALGAGSLVFNAGFYGATLDLANDTGLDFGRAVAVSGTANFVSDRLTAGAAVTHTLGALTLDSAYLTLAAGANVSSGTAGLNFGATTVANYATFDVASGARLTLATLDTQGNYTAFQGAGETVISGNLQSSTDNFSFTKSDAGSLTLSGAANTLETLYQTGGAFVINGGVTTGKRADINGAGSTATLTGPAASWTLREQIFVEGDATTAATLTVANGAALSANYIELGGYTGGMGAAVVTGAGSRLSDTGSGGGNWGLMVGNTGPGSLTISAGGAVTSSIVAVGYDHPGSVLLTGSGSSWTVNNALYLGYVSGGVGSLTVADGATGSSLDSFYLGYADGSGALTVRNAGSKWTAVNGLSVYSGDVTLADGGTLQLGSSGGGALYLGTGTTAHFGTGGASGNLTAAYIGVDGALTFNHTDTLDFTPSIYTGTGAISKQGAGTLVFSADNSAYGGSITVTGGSLRATTSSGALGGGTLALSGGNLELANDSGLNFGVATTVSAGTTITSDRLTAGAGVSHTLGTLTIGAQTLTTARGSLATSGTGGLIFGATTLNAAGAVFDTGANTQLTLGAISGNFAFTKQGSGQLTLGSASTRTGAATTVSGGTLRLTNASALGTTQKTLTLNSGTVQFANNTARTFNGTNLVLGGDATLTSDRTSTGAGVTHTLGTLSIGTQTLTTARGSLATSGTGGLTFGSTSLTGNATFSPGANALLTLGALNDGATARTLTKQGTGTLTLATAAASLINGTAVNVTAGTLNLNHSTALGALAKVTLSTGATVALSTGSVPTLGALNGTGGTVTLGSNTLTVGSATNNLASSFGGAVSGTGGLTKAGTGALTLSGTNTYTGATRVNAGTFFVNGSLANTAVTVASGATLGGSGRIGGLTTLSAGGILSPGNSPGTLTFTQGLTLNTGSILNFELGITSDLIAVTGGTLTGPAGTGGVTLNFTNSSGFAAGIYTLINYTTASGTSNFQASDFTLGSTVAGYTYNLALSGNMLQLTASAIPEPSTYAAIIGACALALAAYRRRRACA
jgi:fibronectin-binding autotransporter adhesin